MIMNINYTKQVWAHLRQDPLISTISVLGTALSIFLIMLVVMLQQVNVAPYSPESNRNRFLHVSEISYSSKPGMCNQCMSEETAKELYKSLKTPEAVTIYASFCVSSVLSAQNVTPFVAETKQTDNDIWHVFDFDFVSGKPYDKATFNAGRHVVVISESVARKLFGKTDVAGKDISLNHSSYQIVGVVKDVSILASIAYAQIWVPYSATNAGSFVDNVIGGMLSATILAHNHNELAAIKVEADKTLALYNRKLKEKGFNIISRNRPYDQEKQSIAYSANLEPDVSAMHRQQFIIIAILLLVPAINLSSMTNSRLRRRISEIGVRRAFGCTRMELLRDIVMENLVTSLLAGVIGLFICVVFAYWGADLIFAQSSFGSSNSIQVNTSMLLQPSTFLYAFVFCFILNLISSIIPAWRASHTNIVNALGGRTR